MAKAKKKAPISKQPASALTITKNSKEKLSPNQSAFNKVTARIEKLRKDIDRREGQLNEALTLYGTAIPPPVEITGVSAATADITLAFL